MLKFDQWIIGEPVSQPRPRGMIMMRRNKRTGGKQAGVHIYTPEKAKPWRDLTQLAFRKHMRVGKPYEGAVKIAIVIYLPRPDCLMRKKDPDGAIACIRRGQGGDWDNLGKPICDALTDLLFWSDDCQVFDASVIKLYHGKDSRPGARVIVEIFEPGDRILIDGIDITPEREEAPCLPLN